MTDKRYYSNQNLNKSISKYDTLVEANRSSSNIRSGTVCMHTIKMVFFSSTIFSLFLILRHRKILLRSYEEQKMSMFSETAFYYSFYEDMVNSSDKIYNIIHKMILDDRTEYPDVINSISRFNIYQEIILGILYRVFKAFDNRVKAAAQLVYSFKYSGNLLRDALGYYIYGDDSIILSTPFNFYYFCVNLILGFGMGVLCGTCTYITGGSYISGFTCMGFLFGNFRLRLLSRISSLPLRENFALPFIWVNNIILISIIRSTSVKHLKKKWIFLYLSSLLLLEFWQFSVFVVSIQLISVYILFLLGYEFERFKTILRTLILVNMAALFTSYLLHFMNYYILLTPLSLVGISILTSIIPGDIFFMGTIKAKNSLKYSLLSGAISLAIFLVLKIVLSPISNHDTHVFDMLKATIFGQEYANFDTMIYKMGGSEFSFITKEQIDMIYGSGVFFIFIPGALLILFSSIIDLVNTKIFNHLEFCENINLVSSKQILNDSSQTDEVLSDSSFDSSISSTYTSNSTMTSNQDWRSCSEHLYNGFLKDLKTDKNCTESKDSSIRKLYHSCHESQDSAVSFLNIQTMFFCLLAIMISRLRVLALPYIAVVSSLFSSCNYLRFIFNYYWVFILKILRINYIQNSTSNSRKNNKLVSSLCLIISLSILSISVLNFPLNEIKSGYMPENNASSSKSRLIGWVNSNLPDNTPILSDMVVSATLRLTTKARIITHPQYEHIKIRKRTQFMYSISACISIKELYETMESQYKAEYLLLSIYRCAAPRDKNAITVVHVTEFLDNINHRCNNQESIFQRTCWRIQLDNQSRYFDIVYRNAHYTLYKRKSYQDLGIVHTGVIFDKTNSNNYSQFPFRRRLLDWNESWKPWIVGNCILNDAFCSQNIVDYARIIIDIYNIIDVSKLLYEKAISIYPNNSYVMFNYAEFLDYDLGDKPKLISEKYSRSIELYRRENSEYEYSKLVKESDIIFPRINLGFGLKMILGFILFTEQMSGRSEFLMIKSIELILENELIKLISSRFEFTGLLPTIKYLYMHKIVDVNFDMCLVGLAYNTCMISSYLKSIESESIKFDSIQEKYPFWLIRTVYNRLWAFSKVLDPNNACIVKYWSLFHNREKDSTDFLYSFFFE
ncbi:transmembrane domain-containing protein [Cryptosporidium canis]|uniref:Transmembrane domain-containing protein n=1 Tax=Cryptosporidium canis TaxID=195482 RepID=A0ABQ8P6M8_9CRYT|nr:transmembrane domain-containing protein [Cryptosporidium canis]